MDRKKFLEGLDLIFESEGMSDDNPILGGESNTTASLAKKEKRKKKARKKRKSLKNSGKSSKSFSNNLEFMLSDALEDSIEEKIKANANGNKSKNKSSDKKKRKSFDNLGFGLDTLIRKTIETSEISLESRSDEERKRITFVFKRALVDKLKTIARIEKSMIRDIVDDLIEDYIDHYEQKKGDLITK